MIQRALELRERYMTEVCIATALRRYAYNWLSSVHGRLHLGEDGKASFDVDHPTKFWILSTDGRLYEVSVTKVSSN